MASVPEVAQLGAVIGRTFAHGLIRAASDLDDAVLRTELDKLVGAGLLFRKGTPPRCTYTFKHALIQDAAYQSLVKKQRQEFHRTVAGALERAFPEVVETQPELLAHHHTEAGDTARGIAYWLRAGQRARERSAHPEAIRDLVRGLELVAGGPEGPGRDTEELGFRMPLSASYIAVRGYAAPEVEEHIRRARELCERLGPAVPSVPRPDDQLGPAVHPGPVGRGDGGQRGDPRPGRGPGRQFQGRGSLVRRLDRLVGGGL